MSMTWDDLDRLRPANEWRLPLPPTCKKCSYNLTGLPEERCPECGTPFTWREVRKRVARVWGLTLRLRYANEDARTGLIMALSGWFSIGFGHLVGGGFILGIMKIIAFLAGLMAVILGSQVLNVRRVPAWARVYICKPPPSMTLGVVTIVLALSLFFGALIF
ncbi:MAG: hypothetical protein HY718_16755 [Planctomycetes bacterium]|nr:hypothetical protein [Planctomycetota bacterium]